MSRVLLVGYNPPQFLVDSQIEAAHYRTWQFLEPLLDDGHEVCLCAGARNEPVAQARVPVAWAGRLTYRPIAFGRRGWRASLQDAHDRFGPDCVVAVNFSHCLYVTKLRTARPIWMDIYGDIITIVQAASFRLQVDRGPQNVIAFMRRVLEKGDAFSGCGTPQQHVLDGELAMCGRLNRHTFCHPLTHSIPPGAAPPREEALPARRPREFLASLGIDDGAFVVLWCGGYNTFTDIDTLFRGLEQAMAEVPRLLFVSAGGSSYAASNGVYDRLLGLVERSPHRARFHMLGWRPWSEVARFYRESDVGVQVDFLHYETLYGTRTRPLEMMAHGLPVITSLGTELSYVLDARGAALAFASGDWSALGRQVVKLATDPSAYQRCVEAAAACVRTEFSFSTTTTPVRDWARRPALAPDHLPRNRPSRARAAGLTARRLVRQTLWRLTGADQ